MEPTVSHGVPSTEHDGIFTVATADLHDYMRRYSPAVLRYDRRRDTSGYPAINFGESKGLAFERVLILPTKAIAEYLSSADPNAVGASRERFYVAVTRARHSVAFLVDSEAGAEYTRWSPEG